jgi:hypothetical protein
MNTKNHAPKAPQSQLAGKTTSGKVVAPESTFGQFVLGDIKGGTAAHEFRWTMVRAAIREALKGNSRALTEAHAIAQGKSKRALCYVDGFQAVGIPARIAYTGKLSDPANKPVVDQIEATTLALAHDFELAFLTRYHAPAEPKATKGGAPKLTAKDYAEAADVVAMLEQENSELKAQAAAAPTIADTVRATIAAINSGVVSDAEMDEIIAAVTYRRLMAAQATAQAVQQDETAEAA